MLLKLQKERYLEKKTVLLGHMADSGGMVGMTLPITIGLHGGGVKNILKQLLMVFLLKE